MLCDGCPYNDKRKCGVDFCVLPRCMYAKKESDKGEDMGRLRSCKHCGRIHASNDDCKRQPKYIRTSEADKFRNTYEWQKKRIDIMKRDLYLCRMSMASGEVVYHDLSVHHIEPLEERYDLRLDDNNLITLSSNNHKLAEMGMISRELLHDLAISPPTLTLK